MKIIIAGAGAVGTHLAKLLSREKQDIILMDDNEERLSTLSSNFDLMTVTASPTSIQGLKEVGAKDADLFIAVTPDESRNMTACMLATNLGAKKTVARIDNYEYLLPKNKEFFKKLGVDSLIYPEMLAAKEIVSSIRMSWVRQWWEFCGGSLILIGTKMREKAEILDIPLHQLAETDKPYHVVAIKRCNETLIPRGDDVIKLHDIVYFTTTRKYVPYIRKIAGKEDYADVRNVMIMGGSRIAVRTAQYVPDYMQVKIIDNDLNRCNRLTELLDDKVMIINGTNIANVFLFSNLCVEKLFVFFVALRVGLDNAALRFADEPDESVAFGTLRNLFFDLLTAVQVVQAALEEDAAGVVNL